MTWKNRIVGQGEAAPEDLLAHPENWRIHPQYQQQAVLDALNTLGVIQNVIVNQRTGHLIDGHLRVTLALRENEPEIPVLYVDLDEDEERLALATLDPLASLASRDNEKLASLLAEVEAPDGALTQMLDSLRLDALAGMADHPEPRPEPDDPQEEAEDYATFECLIERDKREMLFKAINEAKARHGLETSGEALYLICSTYLETIRD